MGPRGATRMSPATGVTPCYTMGLIRIWKPRNTLYSASTLLRLHLGRNAATLLRNMLHQGREPNSRGELGAESGRGTRFPNAAYAGHKGTPNRVPSAAYVAT